MERAAISNIYTQGIFACVSGCYEDMYIFWLKVIQGVKWMDMDAFWGFSN
jgi:hypothetical protein